MKLSPSNGRLTQYAPYDTTIRPDSAPDSEPRRSRRMRPAGDGTLIAYGARGIRSSRKYGRKSNAADDRSTTSDPRRHGTANPIANAATSRRLHTCCRLVPAARPASPSRRRRCRKPGIRLYESRRLKLFTDVESAAAEPLPPLLDALFDEWERYFGNLPPARDGSDYQLTAYLMRDQQALSPGRNVARHAARIRSWQT